MRYDREDKEGGRVKNYSRKKLLASSLKKQREDARQLKEQLPREDYSYRGDAYSTSDY